MFEQSLAVIRTAGWRAIAVVVALLPSTADAADAIELLPKAFQLVGREARQLLVIEATEQGQAMGQIAEGVTFASSDERVVKIDGTVAMPVGDGTATIVATVESPAGKQTAAAQVTVSDMDRPWEWSFSNHVVSVFSKAGCNSGACHGAQAGKNGFKLTLFGYDPAADYQAVARQAIGRRIVPSDPARSLILTKPTGAISHKGGVRFDVGSPEYRVLADWIAAGAKPPKSDDARLERLEVLPKSVRLAPDASQQLIVLAYFTDGHSEDVTRWVKYTSANETVAAVDAAGNVKVMGHGEGAIGAWFLNRIVMATVTVPFENEVSPEVFAQSPRRNFIDEHVLAKLSALNLPPSPPCDDATFIRRAFLDTIGVLPTAEETTEFLTDDAPDKRDRLIERLLGREEFVDYWAYKWSDLLLVNSGKLKPPAMKAYYGWIRRSVAENKPWDTMVRELVTAQGATLENGAANFYVLHQDPAEMSETVSMAFLGMSINCAKCHNHPLEKWTNDQYYGMANLFARVRNKNVDGDGNFIVFHAGQGELIQPTTGAIQPPRPLDAQPIALDATGDRREYLARWLTAPDNPYFTRAITNRVWANYFGVGLVEKIDDLRLTNPASNPQLHAALAEFLVASGFDLKALMRAILQSAAYQRESRALPGNRDETRYYSRYYPKRLSAEVLLDAITRVADVPTDFAGYPKGTRALELPDANVNSYFLKSFGRPERIITCECERSSEPTMVQVLHLSNGDTLNAKLSAVGNRIDKLLAANTSDLGVIEKLYLAALSRKPTDAERIKLMLVLGETPQDERRKAFEDIYWAVLTGKEFLFNH
ncbi:MAG: DUF1549 domain-containing protein [Pirellulales bacterium]